MFHAPEVLHSTAEVLQQRSCGTTVVLRSTFYHCGADAVLPSTFSRSPVNLGSTRRHAAAAGDDQDLVSPADDSDLPLVNVTMNHVGGSFEVLRRPEVCSGPPAVGSPAAARYHRLFL